MPHSSSVVRFRAASILVLQAGIMGQRQQQPVLLGKSPMGTRYYFELVPKEMSLAVSNMDDREVDGFHCYYTKSYVKASKKSKKYDARLYTVDDTIGYKDFKASGKIADETCFETFTPLSGVDKGLQPLFPAHPIVITANRLCTENELLLSEAEEEPAPNGVYYGFIGDELEATIKFDEESQIQHVEVDARQGWRHNVLTFKMIGKAINCVFTKEGSSEEVGLIVEPVDPNTFNGTRESFALARLNTIVGQTFDRSDLRDLLGLTKKFKAVASRVRKGIRGIRELRLMPSRRSRDELRIRLLTEADTEADDYSDRHD
ncbi:hypothetical protein Pmar_PMAR024093 [Perkinsus marinus ATCC 50983]|uniref:Uncharacterized protein n=1 Tax=Perkinsus marinus (strain ATCC 50983 / TXsc) TaxID=423536 RepID=C5L6M4_PERM5|nr:hypothetical protein Pmar_PMAR024093 [Perkinsus marinus ATCC 50983]EER07685.1 hypothetical protein Pmar_PMAR024093 [Perkinsus marinus ATCC 50983]|eukprot:XP_002775869.1 hypothetical protein Pmar_PMAR024093 [Perkinsus marinus ATCC 50983]